MPYDPIERWEWEGGAIAVAADSGDGENSVEARVEPVESAAPVDANSQPATSMISSRRWSPTSA